MANPQESTAITCPICFESFEILIDLTAGNIQSFIYDCEICCRPIQINLRISKKGKIEVELEYGN